MSVSLVDCIGSFSCPSHFFYFLNQFLGREKMLMVSKDGSNAAAKRAGNAPAPIKSVGEGLSTRSRKTCEELC